jgi:hypothetical protein
MPEVVTMASEHRNKLSKEKAKWKDKGTKTGMLQGKENVNESAKITKK